MKRLQVLLTSLLLVTFLICPAAAAQDTEEIYTFGDLKLALTDGYVMLTPATLEQNRELIEKQSWNFDEISQMFSDNPRIVFASPHVNGIAWIVCQIIDTHETQTLFDLQLADYVRLSDYRSSLRTLYDVYKGVADEVVYTEDKLTQAVKVMYNNETDDQYGLVYATVKNGKEYILETKGTSPGHRTQVISDLEEIFTGVTYGASKRSPDGINPNDPNDRPKPEKTVLLDTGGLMAVISVSVVFVVVASVVVLTIIKKRRKAAKQARPAELPVSDEQPNKPDASPEE